ncbi:hypothetical protein Pint_13658 [Pistacia integerrima]|uniref:Uncharacterized protein n=1 Tax=Pistacia integerrima TaxID=434235 RepID=A0ACC0Y4J3_9ROSI|nr:hypothetical protein Pint_13658 [Pistacia integerrima]
MRGLLIIWGCLILSSWVLRHLCRGDVWFGEGSRYLALEEVWLHSLGRHVVWGKGRGALIAFFLQ